MYVQLRAFKRCLRVKMSFSESGDRLSREPRVEEKNGRLFKYDLLEAIGGGGGRGHSINDNDRQKWTLARDYARASLGSPAPPFASRLRTLFTPASLTLTPLEADKEEEERQTPSTPTLPLVHF